MFDFLDDGKITRCLEFGRRFIVWGVVNTVSSGRHPPPPSLSHCGVADVCRVPFPLISSCVLFLVLSAFLIRLPVSRPVLKQCVGISDTPR
jgi:hypothetical protein